MATQTTHLGLTEKQMQAKYRSTGSFSGPRPLCGNGSFHVKVSGDIAQVDCAACAAIIAKKPNYLNI